MPVILRFRGFTFFFYSNEGNPLEPAHIHVRGSGAEAKFWLMPEVELARNDGFNARVLKDLSEIIDTNKASFLEAWNDYFS
ncbi:DUF4160 domain-containing protein [Pectobacterium punjabense]|uniref:DUF4160 domain-containing protein n=2 Tax=Pectobacterium TaxID=122277 RepID=A0A419B2D1_PECCA|nr:MULTISPECIES: DUF4160 domain-containing protein [Pectobacterium]MBA0211958.1 DUF4160 domain-containing protein [Pectobacterium brasiliense]MBS4430998.1 DUF4160 domain-containing protein [Pectobacterium punjabense]PTA65561.1 hypothetical protein C9I36_03995 [Pectobacterium punjabense]QJA19276.1 DUF4160 domain-containing protein [Pectobacterium punjabense]RJL55759.1 DUF4160 domain-containing protein [Pectobacterium carotovorum]